MPNNLTSWSISRFHDYVLCPFKAKLKHILKFKEPANDAMERGSRIHKLAEDWIKGEGDKLPAELEHFKADLNMLRARYKKKTLMTVVEDSWAYTKDWGITTWDDWAGCWLRVKIDCAWESEPGVLVVNDWKTGKYKEDSRTEYEEQLALYALAAMLQPAYAHIHTVKARLAYLDHGIVYPHARMDVDRMTYTRDQVEELKKYWDKRTLPMLSDATFAPRPNRYCGYCHFRKSNSGPCQY